MVKLEQYKLKFPVDNFCLSAQELEHLRLKFYHETRALKTRDAIFLHCFANITTNEIVKNLRLNEKKIYIYIYIFLKFQLFIPDSMPSLSLPDKPTFLSIRQTMGRDNDEEIYLSYNFIKKFNNVVGRCSILLL